MTSGGNNFNDFPEIVLTREITTIIEKIFLFSRPWPWAYYLNRPNAAASINSTHLNPALPVATGNKHATNSESCLNVGDFVRVDCIRQRAAHGRNNCQLNCPYR